MRKMTTLLTLIALLAATTTLAQSVGSVRGGSRERAPVIDAKDLNLQKFEGRVILLTFWLANEAESDVMLPWLSDLQETYGRDGLSVVAVNTNRQSGAAANAVEIMNPHIQVVLDPTQRLVTRYELGKVPSGFLYDRAGGERGSFAGFEAGSIDSLTVDIEGLLKEKAE